ncbi:MAG: eukaryotic-like serine/threonine-protein kinase [Acidobacteriota bacterium]
MLRARNHLPLKRCPRCNRLETDDTLAFCRADGSPLAPAASEETATIRLDSAPVSGDAKTTVLPQNTTHPELNRPPGKPKSKVAVLVVALLAAVVLTAVAYRHLAKEKQVAIQSIAVMPFVNESGNSDVEYLSDGMTETLIGSLSQVPNLAVKSASAVFHYKGKETSAKTLGDELGVQAVLLGRVVQRGDDLKLSLELVNTKTQDVIWSEQYNRQHGDLVTLQSDIARDVSQKLERKFSGAAENLTKKYTANPEAYELYLRGRYHWNRRTVDDDKKALEYFDKAVKSDPSFALAYVGLSDAHLMLGITDAMAGAMSPADTVPPARTAAEKAIELDPNLAEAYASRGHVRWKQRDWAGAEADFKRSIELSPNYPYVHLFYAIFLAYNGRTQEALGEAKRSAELDPYSIPILANYSYLHYLQRRPEEAIAIGKRAVAFDDSIPIGRQRLGLAYEQKGLWPQAIVEFEAAVKQSNRVQLAVASLAHAYAASGNQVEARKLLSELETRSKQQFVSSYLLASVYVALGDNKRALDLLEHAYDEQSIDLVQTKTDPKLTPLHNEPRFQELLKKIGFP